MNRNNPEVSQVTRSLDISTSTKNDKVVKEEGQKPNQKQKEKYGKELSSKQTKEQKEEKKLNKDQRHKKDNKEERRKGSYTEQKQHVGDENEERLEKGENQPGLKPEQPAQSDTEEEKSSERKEVKTKSDDIPKKTLKDKSESSSSVSLTGRIEENNDVGQTLKNNKEEVDMFIKEFKKRGWPKPTKETYKVAVTIFLKGHGKRAQKITRLKRLPGSK